jgi:tetratricopeptide (TPR) repeat protein
MLAEIAFNKTMSTEISWTEKAILGALGGGTFVLLFIINEGFQLEYSLTYLAYLMLGAIAGLFLTDQNLPPNKIQKSAFIHGLLVSSLLFIFLNQVVWNPTDKIDRVYVEKLNNLILEVAGQTAVTLKELEQKVEELEQAPHSENSAHDVKPHENPNVKETPELEFEPDPIPDVIPKSELDHSKNSGFFVLSAHAMPESISSLPIKMVRQTDVVPPLGEFFVNILRHSDSSKKHIFVVEEVHDREKAIQMAKNMNALITRIATDKSTFIPQAYIMMPVNTDEFYVTVGWFNALNDVKRIKWFLQTSAIEMLLFNDAKDEQSIEMAQLVLNGYILSGSDLFLPNSEKAKKWEQQGLNYLIDDRFYKARRCFEKAYKADPQHYNAKLIKNVLRDKEKNLINSSTRQQAKKEVYNKVLERYFWKMPSHIRKKMTHYLNS